MLKFPPFKIPKITEYLVYRTKSKNTGEFVYKMFNREGKAVGYMKAQPETVYNKFHTFSPNAELYDSFSINKLISTDRDKGVGTAFINIAKKESRRKFCLGNLHLIASNIFDRERPPQIFYRKMGFEFNEGFSQTAKIVDECIAKNLPAKGKFQAIDIPMYIEKNVDKSGKLREAARLFAIRFPEIFEFF